MSYALKETTDNELELVQQALAKMKDTGPRPDTADQDTEATIYDFDEFWIVRDRPPYRV